MTEQKTKEQVMFLSDDELQLVKNTFAENDDLLKVLRKHFLQMKMTEWEQEIVKTIKGDVLKVVSKVFLPTLELENVPIGQEMDVYLMQCNSIIEGQMSATEAIANIKARKKVFNYMDQSLKVLGGEDVENKIVFADWLNADGQALYENYIARNMIAVQIKNQLIKLKLLAGQKNETMEETLKKLNQNSNK